jgi:hypothetical protein
MIDSNGFKCCKKCNTSKLVELFYKSTPLRKNDDGYDYYCKQCRNENGKQSLANKNKKCSELECNNNHYALSLCRNHYVKRRTKENKNG